MRLAGLVLGVVVASCVPTFDKDPLPPCDSVSCGGRQVNLRVLLPMQEGTRPIFTVLVERNAQKLPTVTVQVLSEATRWNNEPLGLLVVGVNSSRTMVGGDGGPQYALVVAEIQIMIGETAGPLVNGDTYHVVIEDETGSKLVDESWVATYVDSTPEKGSCTNPETVHCRTLTRELSPLPQGPSDGGY